MSAGETGRSQTRALLAATVLLLLTCSCQAPVRTCQPMVSDVPERESGVTFVTRRIGSVIRLPIFDKRQSWEVLVSRDGAVHFFTSGYDGDAWGCRYWKYESGLWTDFGRIYQGHSGCHPFETAEGRLFLLAEEKVLAREGAQWAVVHTLESGTGESRAVLDEDGAVHVLYRGQVAWLWVPYEQYFTNFPHSTTADKLLHATYSQGRWAKGQPTTGRGPYNPEDFRCACGPGGTVYVVFELWHVLWAYTSFAWPEPLYPWLVLSVCEKGRWTGPFKLMGDPRQLRGAEYWDKNGVPRITGAARRSSPHMVVDENSMCHIVWGNAYLKFKDGACTKPWFMLDDAYATGLLRDREGRLVVFLAQKDKLMAMVRDERGWSRPFQVADQAARWPVLGGDGSNYLAWMESLGLDRARVALQRFVIEERSPPGTVELGPLRTTEVRGGAP